MTSVEPLTAEKFDPAVLQWLQDFSPQGMLVTDTELRIRGWNKWMELNSGQAADQVIGRPLREVFPDLKARRLDRYYDWALKGEASILSSALHGYLLKLPAPLRDLGFDTMQQTARIAPLMSNGVVCGTITVLEDVTQREAQTRKLRAQHETSQLLSWALAELLQAEQPEQFLQRLLPRVARHVLADTFLVYLSERGGGTHLHSASGIPADRREHLERQSAGDVFGAAMSGGPQPMVVSDTHETGQDLRALPDLRSYIVQPLYAGRRFMGVFLFGSRAPGRLTRATTEIVSTMAQYSALALDRARNATELQAAQLALEKHAADLEGRVKQRTAELSEIVGDLESFSYTVAHDLRAPLRHLTGYAKALIEDHGADLGPVAVQYVKRMQRATERMDELTRDLLQYSTVARTEMKMGYVDLQPLIDGLPEQLPALNNPGVLKVDQPLHPVQANATLLHQCLLNLVQNGLKFVAKERVAQIRIATVPVVDPDAAPRVRILVQDNGIGIEPEARHKIFGVFERAVRPDEYEGTGIGLAIVAKAMQKMGGRVGVESQPGAGSTFWLELPAAETRH